jgi:poly-gamma-glutamate capsule biosynthesis protein CapA/YwtB (metallophosphatase superfamily)
MVGYDLRPRRLILPTLVLLSLLVGCGAPPTPDNFMPTVTPVSGTRAPVVTPLAPTSTAARTPLSVAIGGGIGGALRSAIEQIAKSQQFQIVPAADRADVLIGTESQPGALLLSEQIYTVADWFPTLRTGISLQDLSDLWQGHPTADGLNRLLMSDATAGALGGVLGSPGATVERLQKDEIVPRLWQEHDALAIVPFDELEPKLTALPIDGMNVLDRSLSADDYPLAVRVWVGGSPAYAQLLVNALRPHVPPTNRDMDRMTTVVMTGVTAMARFTAYRMEQVKDPAYPARKIAAVLSSADITHISNEIPFVDGCPPNLDGDSIVLCSKPEYIAAMKLVGTDIVGLTGNHMLDYGAAAFLKTLDLYDKEGMKYYAGGRNAAEASRVLVMEDHGNRLAFLGANSFGPESDWATQSSPGAQSYDPAAIRKEIAQGRQRADVVFVEYQAEETYDYTPSHDNQVQFRRTLVDGADVVTGVQAHHPQAVEFSADGKRLILYGLGNLWFDQMFNEGVRQGLIPRHTIYQGRLIQTELLTTMLEEYSQPRWATPKEREQILRAVFSASGFK